MPTLYDILIPGNANKSKYKLMIGTSSRSLPENTVIPTTSKEFKIFLKKKPTKERYKYYKYKYLIHSDLQFKIYHDIIMVIGYFQPHNIDDKNVKTMLFPEKGPDTYHQIYVNDLKSKRNIFNIEELNSSKPIDFSYEQAKQLYWDIRTKIEDIDEDSIKNYLNLEYLARQLNEKIDFKKEYGSDIYYAYPNKETKTDLYEELKWMTLKITLNDQYVKEYTIMLNKIINLHLYKPSQILMNKEEWKKVINKWDIEWTTERKKIKKEEKETWDKYDKEQTERYSDEDISKGGFKNKINKIKEQIKILIKTKSPKNIEKIQKLKDKIQKIKITEKINKIKEQIKDLEKLYKLNPKKTYINKIFKLHEKYISFN